MRRLTPNAITINIDGEDVRMATSKEENDTMNMLMASQMRHLINSMMAKYKQKEAVLTPKELSDLAKAARDVASFSQEVYSGGTDVSEKSKHDVGAKEPADSHLDFSKLTNVTPTHDIQRGNEPNGPNPGGPREGLQGEEAGQG